MKIDYQWPSHIDSVVNLDKSNISNSLENVESFFSDMFNIPVSLFPSARAGLSAILKFENIGRGKDVFFPKWSSHCVIDIVGRYANPTTNFYNKPDVVLLVHKWGQEYKIKDGKDYQLIIEDSVDSIHLSNDAFFQNRGKFELVSLPKTLGSLYGGLVYSQCEDFHRFVRELRKEGTSLARVQAERRKEVKDCSWECQEFQNFAIDDQVANHIVNRLSNWNINKSKIEERLNYIGENTSEWIGSICQNRLGPVLPIKIGEVRNENSNELMFRNFSFEKNVENLNFTRVALLPLHFGVDDKQFLDLFNQIKSLNYKE